MEGKKISFGFTKTRKAEKPVVEENKEYIECLEEKSIKVVGGETVKEHAPLIIPMKPNTLITAERLKQIAKEVEEAVKEEPEQNNKPSIPENEQNPPENETLDQIAVRELLQDAKKENKEDTSTLTVTIPAKPVVDGEKESTLDDYEAVPIQEFGLAMLRGMGWTQSKEQSKYKQPELRPKGLGLGADKVINNKKKQNATNDKDEDLSIVRNAFVKIVIGKYNGCYGKVISLDEDNGRVMVEIPIKKDTVSLSEFMMQPVTKTEFDKQYRVINTESYEEYKRNEEKSNKVSSKHNVSLITNEKEGSSSQKSNEIRSKDRKEERNHSSHKDYENSSNGSRRDRDHKYKRDSSSSEDKLKHKRSQKKYSSDDSLSSLSDRQKRKESKIHHSSSGSEVSDTYKKHSKSKKSRSPAKDRKRDIDKKRKGKKKKRDRDRSPNYRKYKK